MFPLFVIVWVKLPYLPLHYSSYEDLVAIGNSLGNYINKSKLKSLMFVSACSCTEVDLEKGLLEVVKLTMDGCTHLYKLDYEQIDFKYKGFHEYGHFYRNYPSPVPPYQAIKK